MSFLLRNLLRASGHAQTPIFVCSLGTLQPTARGLMHYQGVRSQHIARSMSVGSIRYSIQLNASEASPVPFRSFSSDNSSKSTQTSTSTTAAPSVSPSAAPGSANSFLGWAKSFVNRKTNTDNIGSATEAHEAVAKDESKRKTFVDYLEEAKAGDAAAQTVVGACYKIGLGTEPDEAQAAHWFLLAAEQGDAKGQFCIGTCYSDGSGVKKDPAEAFKWYTLAAENGELDAAYNLGIYYSQGIATDVNHTKAVEWLRKAADQKHIDAAIKLGKHYAKGLGVTADPVQARTWFKVAAEQNHPGAQYNLALSYFGADGGEVDVKQGLDWLKKSAANRFAPAQFSLGAIYMEGADGVEKNVAQAVDLFMRAGESGHFDSLVALGEIFTEGPVKEKQTRQEANAEAVKWLNMANKIQRGHPRVNMLLGYHCCNAKDIPTRQLGMQLLNNAVSQGDPDAKIVLERIEKKLAAEK